MTDTTWAARDHARRQEGTTARSMRQVPPPQGLLWDETVDGGRYAHKALARGSHVRFTDLEGAACVQLLLFNALAPHERLNVADTAKVQWQAYLGNRSLLLTDMGRAIATIVSDTSGHHDLFCGSLAARPLLTLGVARHGLDRRDVHPCVNLLKGARVVDGDALTFTGGAGAGVHVELRLELPTILVLANTPHPLDDEGAEATPVHVTAWEGDPGSPASAPTPEARRAYENTEDLLRGHP